jgi:DNA primase
MIANFDRALLPDPSSYFSDHANLALRGRGKWRSALCPFHDDHQASLSVNVDSGGFCCHACQAKGGDILEFHRLRYGLSFEAAARDLGAWRAA